MKFPPIACLTTAEGIMLFAVEKGKMFQKVVPWKELYKLAKKGKKFTGPELAKDVIGKLDEVLKSGAASEARSRKIFEDLKTVRVAQVQGSVPVMPMPASFVRAQVTPPPPPPVEGSGS